MPQKINIKVCNSHGTKIKQDPQPNFLGLAKASWSSLFSSYTVYKSSILIIFMKKNTLNWGINLVTSCCQLCSVEAGATTRNGPQILWVCRKDTNTLFLSKINYSSNSKIIHIHNPPCTDKITTTLTWNLKYFSKRPVIHKSNETKTRFLSRSTKPFSRKSRKPQMSLEN